MNQVSKVPFGTDASVLAGYAFRANDRLGNFDLIVENTGSNDLYMQLREFNSPSGTTNLGAAFTVEPGGTVTKSLILLSKKVGFFGSGGTTANLSVAMRNPANLRGADLSIVVTGRRGWNFDDQFNSGTFQPNWGDPDDLV